MNVYSSADTQTRNFTLAADGVLEIRCPKKQGQVIAAGRCLSEQAGGCSCPVAAKPVLVPLFKKAQFEVGHGSAPRLNGHRRGGQAIRDRLILERLESGQSIKQVARELKAGKARVCEIARTRVVIPARKRPVRAPGVDVGSMFGVLKVLEIVTATEAGLKNQGRCALMLCLCGNRVYRPIRHFLTNSNFKSCRRGNTRLGQVPCVAPDAERRRAEEWCG